MCPTCARRAPARHAISHSLTDLGLHDMKISTGNDSFTDHGLHDKHIKVEGFIRGVATKYVISKLQLQPSTIKNKKPKKTMMKTSQPTNGHNQRPSGSTEFQRGTMDLRRVENRDPECNQVAITITLICRQENRMSDPAAVTISGRHVTCPV
ncbi:hypothetical protein MSG28_013128 [Choristoneura fumiferana]|uniref:Uncharacterized protein n=1 Tax=Choristoneura fumiferana TaxID=7141 RepID=A0ACC0KSQ1_CHOFU|nr:hypothetical protein MSG28_013128 [Choristoneura fumiferana]